MQKFLKAAAVATAMALVATVAFAAEAKATVKMEAELFGTQGFTLLNLDQKDNDMLQFSAANERAGAEFKLWTNLLGDTSTVHMRAAKLWFSPVSALKISVGNVSGAGYTEQLNWWKVPVGSSIAQFGSWDGRWASNSTGEAGGIQLDITPVEGLAVILGIYPGFGTRFLYTGTEYGVSADTDWGAQVKYNINGFGSVLAAWKDTGLNETKYARVGFDMNAIPGLYAFLSANMRIDNTNAAYATVDTDVEAMSLRGVTIDNYFKYSAGDFAIAARFPVTIRLSGDAGDDSYMTWRVKASYGINGFTPYLSLENDGNVLNFSNVADTFMMIIQPGVAFGIDGCNLDLSLMVTVPAAGADVTWKIPATAAFSF